MKRTESTPQVKALIVKQQATHTQPYPPSGGDSGISSKDSSWVRGLFDASRDCWRISVPILIV